MSIRDVWRLFFMHDPRNDPYSLTQALEMIERLEFANRQLSHTCSVHTAYLKLLTKQTGRDHRAEFDLFFLNYKGPYSDGTLYS